MIASSAFFVLDAILDWPVVNYDGSWSQWGQMAAEELSPTWSTLNSGSPWRTDIPSRSELVVYNFQDPPLISAITYTGTSMQNDLTSSGTFTGSVDRKFRVEIDGIASPNTFRWTKDSAASTIAWDGELVTITTGSITLTDGISVKFGAIDGHALTDRWDFSVPTNRRSIEKLSFDGSVCSSRFNLDGTETVYPAGCIPGSPDSFALSANQIEEEDAVYFGAGGAGSSGDGGGPIAPGY